MKADDFDYEANSRGYMIKYKGENVGGASIMGPYKGRGKAIYDQISDNVSCAKSTIRSLLEGRGCKYMIDRIKEIDTNNL